MRLHVSLIQQPAIDFGKFLGLTTEALGYSLATACDKTQRNMSDAERFISCLNAMVDAQANAGLTPNLFSHVSFSVLVAAEDRDMVDILQATGGMPFVISDTKARGMQIAVITGTLNAWRDAVITGTQRGGVTQGCYCKVHDLFVGVGLNVWGGCTRKGVGDTFYLEHKQ